MKLYLGESEKAREITFEMGLKGQTEFRQPKIKQKRIPDKGITVSQTTEEGKARISYRGLEGLGRGKAGNLSWGLFSRNLRKNW